MESEKFERILAVRASEKEALSTLNTLASHLKDRIPIARDSLAREEFKEKTTLQIQVHADLHLQLLDWAKLQAKYLQERESIASLSEAKVGDVNLMNCPSL